MSTFEEIFFQILYVVVALFAHKKLTYEFSVPKYAIFSIGFSILLSIALIRMMRKGETKFEINLGHIFLLGFALTSLVSTINVAIDRPMYFFYSIDIALYTLLNAFAAIYILNYYKDKERITRFLLVMIATAGFIAVDALYNFYTGKDFFLGGVGRPLDRGSIKATVGNVIFVANYLGMVIPTTIYFLLSYDIGLRMVKGKGVSVLKIILAKALALASLILMIVTVIVSQTRSEYGGVFLTNLMFFILFFVYVIRKEDRSRRELEENFPEVAKVVSRVQRTFVILGVTLVLFFAVLYSIPSPLTGHGEFTIGRRVQAMFSAGSWDERMLAWLSSYYQWKDDKLDPDDVERAKKFFPFGESGAKSFAILMRKLFGRGIGTYQILTISYMGDIVIEHPRFIWGWNNFKRAHNDYFQVLGETGLFGLFFILAMLVYLIIYLFRTLKRLEDRDDALLLVALAMGFADFAIQSFFSFPGHLLPNTLGAIFLASAALSRQFNKDGWMSFEISMKRGSFFALSVAVLILVFTSTYLRWNYFISEVNFKAGNSKYLVLTKVKGLRDQVISEERKIGDRENLIRILDEKVRKVSESLIGRKKTDEIWQKYASLKPSQKFYLVEREIYQQAKSYLMRCLSMNHAYGKAYFYLAALSAWYHRLGDLNATLKTEEDFEKFLNQEFDDFQSFINPVEKRTDLLGIWKMLDEKGKKALRNAFLNFQVILDSISLYETSLHVFNERNTYKALAQRFSLLDKYSKSIGRYVASSKMENKDEIAKKLYEMSNSYYSDFVQYAKTIIHNIPGSWNRFPDWKNYDIRKAIGGQDIYRTMAKTNASLKPPTDPMYQSLLKWLAEKESWATDKMRDRGVWGIPDMVFEYVEVLPYTYYTLGDATNSAMWMDYAVSLYKPHIEDMFSELSKYSKMIDPEDLRDRLIEETMGDLKNWIKLEMEKTFRDLKLSLKREVAKNVTSVIDSAVSTSLSMGRRFLKGETSLESATKPIAELGGKIASIEGVFLEFSKMSELSSRMASIASRYGKALETLKNFKVEDFLKENFSEVPNEKWVVAEEDRLMKALWKDFVTLRVAEVVRIINPKLKKEEIIRKAKEIVSNVEKGKKYEGDLEKAAEYAKSLLSVKLGFGGKKLIFVKLFGEVLDRNLEALLPSKLPSVSYEYPTYILANGIEKELERVGVKVDVNPSRLMSVPMFIYERYARFYGKLKRIEETYSVILERIKKSISPEIYDKVKKELDSLKEELSGSR